MNSMNSMHSRQKGGGKRVCLPVCLTVFTSTTIDCILKLLTPLNLLSGIGPICLEWFLLFFVVFILNPWLYCESPWKVAVACRPSFALIGEPVWKCLINTAPRATTILINMSAPLVNLSQVDSEWIPVPFICALRVCIAWACRCIWSQIYCDDTEVHFSFVVVFACIHSWSFASCDVFFKYMVYLVVFYVFNIGIHIRTDILNDSYSYYVLTTQVVGVIFEKFPIRKWRCVFEREISFDWTCLNHVKMFLFLVIDFITMWLSLWCAVFCTSHDILLLTQLRCLCSTQ